MLENGFNKWTIFFCDKAFAKGDSYFTIDRIVEGAGGWKGLGKDGKRMEGVGIDRKKQRRDEGWWEKQGRRRKGWEWGEKGIGRNGKSQ